MPLTGAGWELKVVRLGQHRGTDLIRTYGRYAVSLDGHPINGLSGFMCECQGPGENERSCTPQFRRRICEGTYPLYTHYTKYASGGYSTTATYPTPEHPLPGFGLEKTDVREGILVHPAHEQALYLASIGCLNPTAALTTQQSMNIDDSRSRVIALLKSLKEFAPTAFAGNREKRIADALIVIEGEPLNWL